MRRGVGVGALQKKFGGKQRRGNRPNHHCEGSSSVARKAMQSLEAIKVIEKDENGGRKISQDGQRDLDRIAAQIKA
jgi:small subunit ribosomal protein S19e